LSAGAFWLTVRIIQIRANFAQIFFLFGVKVNLGPLHYPPYFFQVLAPDDSIASVPGDLSFIVVFCHLRYFYHHPPLS
jgi:hypothetical protein